MHPRLPFAAQPFEITGAELIDATDALTVQTNDIVALGAYDASKWSVTINGTSRAVAAVVGSAANFITMIGTFTVPHGTPRHVTYAGGDPLFFSPGNRLLAAASEVPIALI